MHALKPADLAAKLDELWSPRVIAELDDYYVKVAKLHGEFGWHAHAEEDELFQVLEGELCLRFRDGQVTLQAGELYVVEKGREHNPLAQQPCTVMLVERKSTAHTGEQHSELTRGLAEQLRPIE
ncbi:cupin domain-containing protein [Pseudomarimonas arenosa]|uniref:Cupin domain-containing protein n=1 Tax=Pseudomarimonas arenosa TaxID=2774145 RepID=A0AAW3ZLP6_9GAMM|nr:cupin domain-containing protein [Pseudomarimonas arenosa]MBD8526888.1 cupin domain-containing protein [Pseudomarimonas arenosa]